MPNIHGLHDNSNNDDDYSDDNNDRYVGGVDARGGGSGLAVVPNQGDKASSSSNTNDASDAIFNLAGNT